MENNVVIGMTFEEFLRGKFNAHSEGTPRSLAEAVQDPNLPKGFKTFYGGTLKHRLDVLDASAQGVMLGSAEESFSVGPITSEQEAQMEVHTREFYEGNGYKLYKKDTSGLTDSYFFRNDFGEAVVITCTLPWDNKKDRLLVSANRVRAR